MTVYVSRCYPYGESIAPEKRTLLNNTHKQEAVKQFEHSIFRRPISRKQLDYFAPWNFVLSSATAAAAAAA